MSCSRPLSCSYPRASVSTRMGVSTGADPGGDSAALRRVPLGPLVGPLAGAALASRARRKLLHECSNESHYTNALIESNSTDMHGSRSQRKFPHTQAGIQQEIAQLSASSLSDLSWGLSPEPCLRIELDESCNTNRSLLSVDPTVSSISSE